MMLYEILTNVDSIFPHLLNTLFCEVQHPHIMMLPPPYFAVQMVFLRLSFMIIWVLYFVIIYCSLNIFVPDLVDSLVSRFLAFSCFFLLFMQLDQNWSLILQIFLAQGSNLRLCGQIWSAVDFYVALQTLNCINKSQCSTMCIY